MQGHKLDRLDAHRRPKITLALLQRRLHALRVCHRRIVVWVHPLARLNSERPCHLVPVNGGQELLQGRAYVWQVGAWGCQRCQEGGACLGVICNACEMNWSVLYD